MPKIIYSLAIASVLHIFILGLSTLLIDKEPITFFAGRKSMIDVQLGNSISNTSSKRNKVSANPGLKVSTPSESSISQTENPSQSENLAVGGSGSSAYDFAASAVSYKDPVYPKLAIKRELQGDVKVRVAVTSEGKPSNIEILKSSGHDLLDKAAIEAMASWRFLPREAPYFVEKTILFQLKN